MYGFRFEVQSLGFRVQGYVEFGLQGLERGWGLAFRKRHSCTEETSYGHRGGPACA